MNVPNLCYDARRAWRLSAAQYNNLLAAMRPNLLARRFDNDDEYSFIGTVGQYNDAMRRCAYL